MLWQQRMTARDAELDQMQKNAAAAQADAAMRKKASNDTAGIGPDGAASRACRTKLQL